MRLNEDLCSCSDILGKGVKACNNGDFCRSWQSLDVTSSSEKPVLEVKARSKSLTQLSEPRAPDSPGGIDRMAPHSRFRNLVKEAQVRKSNLTKFIDVLKENLAVSVNRIKHFEPCSSSSPLTPVVHLKKRPSSLVPGSPTKRNLLEAHRLQEGNSHINSVPLLPSTSPKLLNSCSSFLR
ncbi:hypothetical protein RCL1_004667 [Eukaryota sp. TZLM3-RCL]